MCMSKSPKIPDPPPPPQPAKDPEVAVVRDKGKNNRSSAAMGGGSLLTGPAGVQGVSTGRTSLLGG